MPALFERSVDSEEFPVKAAEMTGTNSFLYHWHEEVEMIVCLEGCVSAGIEGRPYRLAKGEVLIIPERTKHCLFPEAEESKRRVVKLLPEFLLGARAFQEHRDCFSRIPCHSREWPDGTAERIADIMRQVTLEYKEKRTGWKEQAAAKLYQMVAVFLREVPQTEKPVEITKKLPLTKVLEYLTEHYTEAVSLKSCAVALGFHEGYLSGLFKKQVGISFHQYLIKLRLQKAEWLLVQTKQSIEEVSELAGFQSVKTFHRVFQEEYGVSPGVWRREQR